LIKSILALIGLVAIITFATSSDGSVQLDIPKTIDDLQESYEKIDKTSEHLGVIYDETKQLYDLWKTQSATATGDI